MITFVHLSSAASSFPGSPGKRVTAVDRLQPPVPRTGRRGGCGRLLSTALSPLVRGRSGTDICCRGGFRPASSTPRRLPGSLPWSPSRRRGALPSALGRRGSAGAPGSLGRLTEGSLLSEGAEAPGRTRVPSRELCSSTTVLLGTGKLRLGDVRTLDRGMSLVSRHWNPGL